MFNYDWFHRGGLERQMLEAKRRCAVKKFASEADASSNGSGDGVAPEVDAFAAELETRVILYLKDGLSYEMRELADVGTSSALSFECVPVDENYNVGSYVIVVPFEDIARVEVYAVHPDEKPAESLKIPGFRASESRP